jgi:ribosome-binding protein aMBF1 (putative translation factor)
MCKDKIDVICKKNTNNVQSLFRKEEMEMETKQYLEAFGRRIRRRRMACGLLQKDLAEKLQWPQGHVSRLEKGEFLSVRLEKLHALADVLGTSVDYLIGRTPEAGDIPSEHEPAAVAMVGA